MEALLAQSKRLGCTVVSTETGTRNRQSEWIDDPENDTEAAYVQCRDVLARLAARAESYGACVAIEPYWQNVIRTIERAKRLIDDIPSPGLKFVMDPCNYYRREDLPRMAPMLRAMFEAVGDRIVVAHAKDLKASETGTDLPAAGLGVLDYPLFLQLLAGLNRPIDLILEHLARPDVPRARDFVRAQLAPVAPARPASSPVR